ncbi:MAG: MATE family efflux transporter [Eubacterium sp.]|nr:MATE family efflux transporter [Eubacterium sp.]
METKSAFFTKDKEFYHTLFRMLLIVSLQNIVAYTVNMADNMMLGRYSQDAMSGAATVNQIYFIVQQMALAIGEALVMLTSQYWGQKRLEPIRKLTGTALYLGVIFGVIVFAICAFAPEQVVGIFTDDGAIIAQGVEYLRITKYSYILFVITSVLMSSLRSVETVNISFVISCVSLIVNVAINYALIFGKFGCPELGVVGAAVGTLVARAIELAIVVFYMLVIDKKLKLFSTNFLKLDKDLTKDYRKVAIPVILSQLLWAVSVPFQTAILGHLSADAIAANSVATTFYSYLKVIVQSMSAVSAVLIGRTIGRGNMEEIKADARTLQVADIAIGIVLGVVLFLLRNPLLSFYSLTDSAMTLAAQLLVVMAFIMVGMSYQMPVSMGIIRGGGDARFTLIMNTVSTWAIVIPLSLMSAFWWKWPVVLVVIMIQSDQVFKCLPTALRIRKYDKWIKKMTRENK